MRNPLLISAPRSSSAFAPWSSSESSSAPASVTSSTGDMRPELCRSDSAIELSPLMPAWCGVAGDAMGELVNWPPKAGLVMSGGRLDGCDEDEALTGVAVEAVDAESVLFDGIGTGGLCDSVSA